MCVHSVTNWEDGHHAVRNFLFGRVDKLIKIMTMINNNNIFFDVYNFSDKDKFDKNDNINDND